MLARMTMHTATKSFCVGSVALTVTRKIGNKLYQILKYMKIQNNNLPVIRTLFAGKRIDVGTGILTRFHVYKVPTVVGHEGDRPLQASF